MYREDWILFLIFVFFVKKKVPPPLFRSLCVLLAGESGLRVLGWVV
jgi:hypothetical protein